MIRVSQAIFTSLILIFLLSFTQGGKHTAVAQEEEPPKRQTSIVISTTQFEWWLIRWADNQIVCQLFIDHDGLPTSDEVAKACDQSIYEEWKRTPPCEHADKGIREATACTGMYIFSAGSETRDRTVDIDLPLPTAWLSLTGCTLTPPENLCKTLPSLLVSGEEPLPNEHISAIHAVIGKKTYTCNASECEIPLNPTIRRGITVEFWAESSFGDTSEHYTAFVRVVDSGATTSPVKGGWYVDVISTQWREGKVESCAQIWDSFPPIGGPPFWLSNPIEEDLLASDEPFHYLAGRLIDHGLVDVTDCPDGGLLPNGYASACGLEFARPMVNLWQNQFDEPIIRVAQETGLPTQLLKNMFAQESQFWPGIFRVPKEFGLGQMTELGADTVMVWNPKFFDQFCPLVLDDSTCSRGYLRLKEDESALLRGALALQANADCPECPEGIDFTSANLSVTLFAQSLLANCSQVSRTIFNATNSSPGQVSTYEDLWRFTLANYNAGPGCLAFAIHTTWLERNPLEWVNVSNNFTEACRGAIAYVDLITR